MFLAVASIFAACSDDDASWNTNADVTVGMAETSVSVKENRGIFNVPIAVTGETNAPVRVVVGVRETGTTPAKKDVNYMMTDSVIVISGTQGNVEIKTVDDPDINETRTFELYIVSAEGAKVGTNAVCTISLRDNDAEFYEKLQGAYEMKAVGTNGTAYTWNVNVTGGDEGTSDYNKYLYVSGMMGYSWTEAVLVYDFDAATQQGSVSFGELGNYTFADNLDFGLGQTPCSVELYQRTDAGLTTEPIEGAWSSDFNTITFNPEKVLSGAIFYPDGSFSRYTWFNVQNIVMTRK